MAADKFSVNQPLNYLTTAATQTINTLDVSSVNSQTVIVLLNLVLVKYNLVVFFISTLNSTDGNLLLGLDLVFTVVYIYNRYCILGTYFNIALCLLC